MRCLGARICPSPRPKPLPIRLWEPACAVNKTSWAMQYPWPWGRGRPGRLPCQAAWRTESPWPLYQCLQTFPLFSGDLGGPACCPPSVFSSPCCHVSLLPNWVSYPSSALGVGARFLRPHALDCPRPQSGNSGHQVPCIEPPLLVSFSQT